MAQQLFEYLQDYITADLEGAGGSKPPGRTYGVEAINPEATFILVRAIEQGLVNGRAAKAEAEAEATADAAAEVAASSAATSATATSIPAAESSDSLVDQSGAEKRAGKAPRLSRTLKLPARKLELE